MSFCKVEHLRLAIYYQNLLIHPLLLHMLIMKKVIKVFSILRLLFFKLLIIFVLIDCDSQLFDLEVSNSIQLRGIINYSLSFLKLYILK